MTTKTHYQNPRRIPSYRLHKSSGKAIVTLDGRDIYLGDHESDESREKYNRLIAEWIAGGYRLAQPDIEITLVELIDYYWQHVCGYYVKDGRPTSEQLTIKVALRIVKELYGRMPVCEFSPLALKTVRQGMIDKDWCRSHVNKQISRVKTMFKWAVADSLIPPSVLQGLQAVDGLKRGRTKARETEPVRPVPDAYVDAIFPYTSRQVWAMVQLQRLTGMRSGEVTIMRGCDLDTSSKVWIFTPMTHKGEHYGCARQIYLGPKAQEIINDFLKPDLTAFLFSPTEAEAERKAKQNQSRKTPMTPSQHHRAERAVRRAERGKRKRPPRERYDSQSYARAIKYAIKHAFRLEGMTSTEFRKWKPPQHWHPHQLRHNAATWLRKEFGIEIARIILGHKSPAITEVYAELDAAKAHEVIGKVG